MPEYHHDKRPGKAIDPAVQARAAELVGMGLSQREAAGAVGISDKSVERILRKPEYKKLADDVRKKRTSVTVQAAAVVQELLGATNKDGTPDMSSRQRGAELVMKNPQLLEHVEDLQDEDDSLLPGVVLRFPWSSTSTAPVVSDSRDSEPTEHAEANFALDAESEYGTTLPSEAENGIDVPAPTPVETLNLEEPEPDPVPVPVEQPVPPALGMTDPTDAHTHVQIEPAPMFTEADLG